MSRLGIVTITIQVLLVFAAIALLYSAWAEP